MPKQVELTDRAENDLQLVTDYLFNKWGATVVNDFLIRFKDLCLIISDTLGVFPLVYKSKRIRKAVLTKHNSV